MREAAKQLVLENWESFNGHSLHKLFITEMVNLLNDGRVDVRNANVLGASFLE